MNSDAAAGLPGTPGDYHGRPTRRLDNGRCWIEFIAEGGPRIVGFGMSGEESILAETPEVAWDVGHGNFELLGGHRLWFAPETPDCSVPDSTGLVVSAIDGAAGPAARLTGALQAPTGLRKTVEIRLDPDAAAVSVRHIFFNEGSREIELSSWPITQLKLGGIASVELPEQKTAHDVTPNQLVVLWPYASWADDRLTLGSRSLEVAAKPGMPFKVGCLSLSGSVSYARDGLVFAKRFDPAPALAHADLGCNVEIYCDQGTIELESLGPLVRLAPGEATTHDERWELTRIG